MTPHQTRTSLDDLAALHAELAALVSARIPLEASLRRLGNQLPKGAAELATRLADRMEQGATLAEALDQEGDNVPEMYRAVVVAGIESRQPAAALEAVANSAARLASLRQTTGMALLVPVAVVITASVLLGLVFWAAFGNIAWIAPKSLARLEAWAHSPWVFCTLTLVVPALAVAVPLVWWLRTKSASALAAPRFTLFGWIPGAGKLCQLTSSATFAEVLRLGIVAGLPSSRALRNAGVASGNRRYERAAETIAQSLDKGKQMTWEEGLEMSNELKQLPSLVRVAIQPLESRAYMEAALSRAARSYQLRAEAQHAALVGWVPALLTIGVAGTITAAYAVLLTWPYATMLETMASSWWK